MEPFDFISILTISLPNLHHHHHSKAHSFLQFNPLHFINARHQIFNLHFHFHQNFSSDSLSA